MPATFSWSEDNGAATTTGGAGGANRGTTRTNSVTQVNWKSVDDVATAYTAAPITAGQNSFTKYQFGVIGGTFNQVSAGKWAHTGNSVTTGTDIDGTNVILKGVVTSTYATPSQTTNAALTQSMSGFTAIGSGQTVLFHTGGPEGASPTATLSAAGFTQYMATQLQTTSGAAAGDTDTATLTFQYNEN